MSLSYLAPIPIIAALLTADVLSPQTPVELGWILGGCAASLVLVWRAASAHKGILAAQQAAERRLTIMETRFDRLLNEHDRVSCRLGARKKKTEENGAR